MSKKKKVNPEWIKIYDNAPVEVYDRQEYFLNAARNIVTRLEEEAGRKLTCCVNTFGCQMNARDSEKILGILERVGYEETDSEKADFVIYNTCTVRENANLKVYGHLGFMSNAKKKNPDMIVCLCGCMMQEETVVEKIKNHPLIPDVPVHGLIIDIVTGELKVLKEDY